MQTPVAAVAAATSAAAAPSAFFVPNDVPNGKNDGTYNDSNDDDISRIHEKLSFLNRDTNETSVDRSICF